MKNTRLIFALSLAVVLLAVVILNLSGAWPTAAVAPERVPDQSALLDESPQVRPAKTCEPGSERPYPPCYLK
jgi:hypothetical protein